MRSCEIGLSRLSREFQSVDESVILYTTWPDAETAEAFAAEAVADRLAACANLLAPMISIYRWEGAIERSAEVPMLLKTTVAAAPRLRDRLLTRHPYEVPCVLALRVDEALSASAFADWIRAETT
jgi:periplasmic divalent cation tolerance protein